jgi:hypothetical protein
VKSTEKLVQVNNASLVGEIIPTIWWAIVSTDQRINTPCIEMAGHQGESWLDDLTRERRFSLGTNTILGKNQSWMNPGIPILDVPLRVMKDVTKRSLDSVIKLLYYGTIVAAN